LDIQTHFGENPNPPDTDGNGKEGSSHVKKWSNDCNRIDERRIYRSDSDLLHGCSEKSDEELGDMMKEKREGTVMQCENETM